MNRLPQVTAGELLAALQRGGFVVDRIKGSHHFLQHKDNTQAPNGHRAPFR